MATTDVREEFQILAARLQAAMQFQEVYPPRHPQVEQAVRECYAELREHLKQNPKILIALAGREFVVGSIQIPIEGELLEEFAKTLDEAGVQKLIFYTGLRQWELRKLLTLLPREPLELEPLGGIEKILANDGVKNIIAGTVKIDASKIADPESLFRTWEAYSTGLKLVRSLRQSAREKHSVEDIAEVKDFAQQLVGLAIRETRPLLAVQSLKTHDEYSFTHSVNVAMLTIAMAHGLPFDQDELHEIGVSALLHDIGKETIPLEILQKPGKLTPEEWDVVNRHGMEGARMLAEANDVTDLAPIVAYEHHLAYHEELRVGVEWAPHLVSQIVCLADVYDALRSVRPYRGEIPPDEAMEIMEGDVGKKFDPDLFKGFSGMLGYYPPGTCVRLENGAIAVSHATNPDEPRRPRIVVVRDPAGKAVSPAELVDLAAASDPQTRFYGQISEVIDARENGVEPLDYL